MATSKGINISGAYVVHHNCMPFAYVYIVFKNIERSDRFVFYILYKTQRTPNTMF